MEEAKSSKDLMNAGDIFRDGKGICPECNIELMAPKNLYAHVRDIHYWQEKEVIALKAAYKRSKSNEEIELPCECGQIFFSKRGLLTHQQKVHGLDNASGWVVCPECEKRFTRYSSLANHCRDYHHDSVPGQDYSVIKGQMQNWQEFESWKRAKELATRTYFVIRRTYETMEGRTIIFVCQRSRGTRKDVDVRAVRQRYPIPRRINSHCTAFLNVLRLDDGTVQYFGCIGHIGHPVTTATPTLPLQDEAIIVEMMKSGSPPSVVMRCCPVCGKNRGRRSFAIFSYGRPSQMVLLSCLLRYKIIGMRRATSVCVVMRNTQQHRLRICRDHFIQTAFFLGLEIEQLLGHFPFNGISGVPANVIEEFMTHVRMFSSLIDDTVSIEEKDVVTLFNDCLVAYFKDVVKELFYAEKREAQECTDASSPSTSTGRPVTPIPKDKRRSVCGGLLPQPPDAATCSSSPTSDFDSSIEQSCFDQIEIEDGNSPSRDVDVADEILFNLSSHSLSFLKQDSSEHECGPTSEMLQCSLCGRERPRKRLKAAPTDPLQSKMLFSCLVRDKIPSSVALRFYEENCSGRVIVCKFHYAQAAYCIGDQVRRRPEEKYPVTGLGNLPDDILRNIVDRIRSYGIVIEKEFSVDSVINFYNLCRTKFCPNAESDEEIQLQNGSSSEPASTSVTPHEEKDLSEGNENPWAEVKEEVDDGPPDPDACSYSTEERDEQNTKWTSVHKKLNNSKQGAADGIRKAMLKSDPNKSFKDLAKEVFSSPPTKKKRGEGPSLKVEDTLDESLRQEQEACSRLEICSSLYLRNKLKGFLDRIVVYEEEWIIYDHKNPFARKPSKNSVPATASIAKEDTKPKEIISSKRKALLSVWWSSSGVIVHKVLTRSPRQVGRAFASYIHHMKRNLIKQQLSLALGPAPIFLYDTSSEYLANSMVETLCRFGFECLPYPCNTPMLSPHANYVSSNFASYLSDKKEIEDLSKAFCDFVKSKSPSFFKDGLSELPVRWERCINLRGF